MAQQSSMHPYLNWTKQRLDEMDATLASLATRASQVKADVKVKADQLVKRYEEATRRVPTQSLGASASRQGCIAGP